VLTLLEQPDYETKTSYTVAIKTTESGANPKSYTETFTIAVTNADESGAFGISSDTVTWTDYNPANSTDITNKVMASTTGSTVAMGSGSIKMNLTNLSNLFDADTSTVGKSPNLEFTLDSVPTGTGTSTIKATIIQGNDATRSGTESEISVLVTVGYAGDGTTAELTMPAGGTGTVSYTTAAGTSASYTVTNVDADAFSITAANAATGDAAVLSVKMGALYDVFVNSELGAPDMLRAGDYSIALETTLPLQNYANETVTKFTGGIELTTSTMDSIIGSNGADTISGGATGEVIVAGAGKDTISTGAGADYIVLATGFGSTTLANTNTVSDFTNGTDKFALDGLTFAELTVAEDATTSADTNISITATGEYLMTLTGVAYGYILADDFVLEDAIGVSAVSA
jgi:Ca2+-binding RTX toxin-like protein